MPRNLGGEEVLGRVLELTRFGLVCLAGVMASVVANADTFTFSFTGGTITSSGTITATHAADNVSGVSTPDTFEITGISGTFTDTANGVSGSITGLYGGTPTYVTPTTATSLNPAQVTSPGGFTYDDLLFPLGNSPLDCPGYPFSGGYLDTLGVAFTVSDGGIGEFFSNGVISPGPGLLSAAASVNARGVVDEPNQGSQTLPNGVIGSFTVTAPEPSAFLLLGSGLATAAAFRRWRNALKG